MQHAKEEPAKNAQQAEETSDARLGADLLKAALKTRSTVKYLS
jgi:hypothetical protein